MTNKVILEIKANEDLFARWHILGKSISTYGHFFENGYQLHIDDFLHMDKRISDLIKILQQLRKDTADHILQDNHTQEEISHGKD